MPDPLLPADWSVKSPGDKCRWFDTQNLKYHDVPLSKCFINTQALYNAIHITNDYALKKLKDEVVSSHMSDKVIDAFDNLQKTFEASAVRLGDLLQIDLKKLLERANYRDSAHLITEQIIMEEHAFNQDNFPTDILLAFDRAVDEILTKLPWLADVHPVLGASFKDLFEKLKGASKHFWELLKAEQDKTSTENTGDPPA